jgi:hypothetical protein
MHMAGSILHALMCVLRLWMITPPDAVTYVPEEQHG